jgi:hypothetical protein
MTRLTPTLTSLKTLNITYPTPQETLLSTPQTLPTTEPATPQISYTVAAGDFPTFNPPVYMKKHIALLYAGGKAVTAATISWRMKKNGLSVATGTINVAANTFYTLSAFFGVDIVAGDVLEIALWSNQTDSNWDYKAYQIQATRVLPTNKPRYLTKVSFTVGAAPALTLGNPSVGLTQSLKIWYSDIIFAAAAASFSVDAVYGGNNYGIYRLGYADSDYANTGAALTDATYRPRYYRNYVITQIVYRGLRID